VASEIAPPKSDLLRRGQQDPLIVRCVLIGAAVAVIGVLVLLPVIQVFSEAFAKGVQVYWNNVVADPDTRHALGMTIVVAALAVLFNVIFGLAASWAIAHFRFPGRALLLSLIDLPFTVSPVVAGLSLVLLFGAQSYLGEWLQSHGVRILFAMPGLVLATSFVTLPFIARELVPLMESLGQDEELAAISLGASGWQAFWLVTMPNIRWGLLYGIILCTARAVGEFGAVNVITGRIAGRTDTLPLRVERLFQDSNMAGSFAVASMLTLLALVSLIIKTFIERKKF
jgi:sulfate/thiosulfate transport system permease protein